MPHKPGDRRKLTGALLIGGGIAGAGPVPVVVGAGLVAHGHGARQKFLKQQYNKKVNTAAKKVIAKQRFNAAVKTQVARKTGGGSKGKGMSCSQAASVAAHARWHGGGGAKTKGKGRHK